MLTRNSKHYKHTMLCTYYTSDNGVSFVEILNLFIGHRDRCVKLTKQKPEIHSA